MLHREKVVDIELSQPLATIENLDGYTTLRGLVRLYSVPIGYIQVPVVAGRCESAALSQTILEQHTWQIMRQLLCNGLTALPKPEGLRIEDLVDASPPPYTGDLPLVTVAVCTRDRTADLALCLDALNRLDYPALDILIVDNAPTSDATEDLIRTSYPHMRHVCEPRPGLDWARNRAIIEAQGEILAYTDDDVMVDSGWVKALARVFAENPEVAAVTGLVVPYELETEAQLLFEEYGGFGRGFERKWFRADRKSYRQWLYHGSGQFGTGANMAYRRSVFNQIGYFDPALDVGTVTNGGGDLEMFFRVLKEQYTLVYEPSAIVRHRHRREYAKLQTQIANNGIGLFSYFVRGCIHYPDERLRFIRLGLWWLWYWNIRRLLISLINPAYFPHGLILAELQGCFIGLGRYQKAHQTALQFAETFGSLPQAPEVQQPLPRKIKSKRQWTTAVRTVELNQPLHALTDLAVYSDVRIFVTWNNQPLGSADVANRCQPISTTRLRELIVDYLGLKLLEPNRNLSQDFLWSGALAAITQRYKPTENEGDATVPIKLPADVSVSIVVATYDRPNDLRNCLCHLIAQASPQQVEIVVVDNHSASGLTPPVVAEFPDVVLVNEPRQGLAYARNAGFVASKGDILVATDDDVTVSSDWLEKLIAPFIRPEVMIVTGNVLPLELENPTQVIFEDYGGLGRGFQPYEVDWKWFKSYQRRAVPTWSLGATANAAFRANIFSHPQIGLIDEALGAGMPTGCSEDTYLFYKVLKAGYTIVYEPAAYVWHKHRCGMPALRRQLYNYSKGHVAYHLTTLLRDHDLRGLVRITIELPQLYIRRINWWFRGWGTYPLSLILLEIAGNLAGPWSLWQSRRRVKREGHSGPYIPVSQRSTTTQKQPLVESHQYAETSSFQ